MSTLVGCLRKAGSQKRLSSKEAAFETTNNKNIMNQCETHNETPALYGLTMPLAGWSLTVLPWHQVELQSYLYIVVPGITSRSNLEGCKRSKVLAAHSHLLFATRTPELDNYSGGASRCLPPRLRSLSPLGHPEGTFRFVSPTVRSSSWPVHLELDVTFSFRTPGKPVPRPGLCFSRS